MMNSIEVWYTVDEVRWWAESEVGLGEHAQWLTAQLNAAFNKGQQIASGQLLARLDEIRTKLESIVCTEGTDAGVVMLSYDGPTHTEIVNGQPLQVYDHEYFSPLGDALMELYKLTAPPAAAPASADEPDEPTRSAEH